MPSNQPPPAPPARHADGLQGGLALATRYRVRGDLPVRRVGGQVHVMTADGRIHTLDNPTAANAWESLEAAGDQGVDAREVAASLVARFDVEPSRAVADAVAFLSALAEAGLLIPGGLAADAGRTTGSRD